MLQAGELLKKKKRGGGGKGDILLLKCAQIACWAEQGTLKRCHVALALAQMDYIYISNFIKRENPYCSVTRKVKYICLTPLKYNS